MRVCVCVCARVACMFKDMLIYDIQVYMHACMSINKNVLSYNNSSNVFSYYRVPTPEEMSTQLVKKGKDKSSWDSEATRHGGALVIADFVETGRVKLHYYLPTTKQVRL